MTGHTAKGFPYALGTDPLTDWPATSLELANLLERFATVAYAEVTANVVVVAASEATANPIVTLPAFTANGTDAYTIEAWAGFISLIANSAINYALYDAKDGAAAASVGWWSQNYHGATGQGNMQPAFLRRRLVPAAGSHVYSLRGWQQFAGGGLTLQAGAGGAPG